MESASFFLHFDVKRFRQYSCPLDDERHQPRLHRFGNLLVLGPFGFESDETFPRSFDRDFTVLVVDRRLPRQGNLGRRFLDARKTDPPGNGGESRRVFENGVDLTISRFSSSLPSKAILTLFPFHSPKILFEKIPVRTASMRSHGMSRSLKAPTWIIPAPSAITASRRLRRAQAKKRMANGMERVSSHRAF